ncbi:DUF4176 domain-containing protein [Bacillus velezensis]|uniref:DUF4176 domain-containing protein n=1 Tax=Bacillus velezensis TaxID=492670 RepID=UPI002DB6A17D|nr:DUF4176 domain-containing protein [Bacillus velezensis]MEC2352555.1 DUF4176 domain-containing protein [Bacillus velezensis]
MKEDVLLPIGTIFKAKEPGYEDGQSIIEYIIIGKRTINPQSMRAWDYIVFPFDEGYKNEYKEHTKEWENNFVYFNHTDIEEVIKSFEDSK